jgi:hypothetical protein
MNYPRAGIFGIIFDGIIPELLKNRPQPES